MITVAITIVILNQLIMKWYWIFMILTMEPIIVKAVWGKTQTKI